MKTTPSGSASSDPGIARERAPTSRPQEGEPGFRSIVEGAPDPIFIQTEGRFAYLNPASCRLFGIAAPEELIGAPILERIHPDSRELVTERIRRLNEERKPAGLVAYRFLRMDGQPIWAEVKGVPIDYEGKAGSLVFVRDITERKQADEQLKWSEEKFSKAFRATSYGIAITRIADGRFLDVNDAFVEVTGYSRDDILASTSLELGLWLHSEDRERLLAELRNAGMVRNRECQFRIHSGKVLTCQLSIEILSVGGEACLLACINDITERQRTEEALQDSEARMRQVIDSMQESMSVIDGEGEFLFANEQAARNMTGGGVADLVGRNIRDLVPSEQARRLMVQYREVVDSSQSRQQEVAVTLPGGVRWFLNMLQPMRFGPDRRPAVLSISLDITERKRAEEALREGEERLRLAMKAADSVAWDWDVVRDERKWSAGAMAVFGWSDAAEQQQEEDWWIQRVHAEDRERVESAFDAAVDDPGCFHWQDEYRFRKGDGQHAHVIDQGDIVRDGSGRALRMTGAMHDESGRRKAEAELRLVRERLALAVDGSNDGIWDWDLRTNALYLSPRWKDQVGYADEELPNEFATFEGRIHPEDRAGVLAHADRYLAGELDRYEMEFRLRHRDGSYRWILARGAAQRDAEGKPYRMSGSHTDITERKRAEEKYETLFRAMLDGFALHEILCDEGGAPVDYRFLAVNPAFERLTGLQARDIVGRTVLEVLPGTEKHWIETYGRVALTGEPATFESPSAALGKHFEVTAFRPAPRQFACVFVDVSERKRAEAELQLQALVLNQIADHVTITDLDGVITYVNDSEVEALGQPREKLIGQPVATFGEDPAQGATQREILETTLRDGFWRGEVVNIAGGGDRILMDCRTRVVRDPSGRPVALCGIATNVTERKKAEEALREQARELEAKNRHLECLFTLSHLLEQYGDQGGRVYSMVAEAVQGTLRRSGFPVVELEIDDLIGTGAEGAGTVAFDFRLPIVAKGRRRGEIRAGRKPTAPPLALAADEINLLGAVAEHIARLVDRLDALKMVRDRQLKLIQADKLASLGIMVAGVAHEINNPVNTIMLNASLLRDFVTDVLPMLDARCAAAGDFMAGGLPYSEMRASLTDLMQGILDGSERIRSITHDLRDATPGRIESTCEPTDVNQTVRSSLRLCSHMDKRMAERVELGLADALPFVWCDRRRLEQVLVNLLQNAWQSLRRPGARIFMATGLDREGGRVVVDVRDEGCGMSADVLSHIKEPFFTTRRECGGTGLGIAISNNLVEGMGGGLEFESTPGEGTTARIRLPVPQAGAGEA